MYDQRQRELECGLLLFESRRLIARIGCVRDIFEYRHTLKQAVFSGALVEHVTGLVHGALFGGQRFRVFDSLKVLRAVVVAGTERQLPLGAVKRLFAIYQKLILDSREEIQWCLSRLIKEQELEGDAISWLLHHWADSVHVLNRLLRYPVAHPGIVAWARERYQARDLDGRRSEVVAILLPTMGLESFQNEDPEVVGWAIMYSLAPPRRKLQWLKSMAGRIPVNALVTYSVRLNAPVILRVALRELRRPAQRNRSRSKCRHAAAMTGDRTGGRLHSRGP